MSYLVLARKWRPKSFEEMIGQQHIRTIMTNSLNNDKIHHAYLYCGTRGVGKTTTARIFAKCLNCEKGVSATPCNQCSTCTQIDAGNFPDLIEIDAASRTKVEDTRELLDNVQYAPTAGRYKVYLIDEVHMLSGHSFNALLKTLEEPPEHVKFLLATTDPQKLPITVLSRCLKLQLKMLSISEISGHLNHVLQAEKITFENEALLEIAKAAQGSMRDALSLLDQAIVFCNEGITHSAICEMLGTTSSLICYELLEAIANQNTQLAFDIVEEMQNKSCNFSSVIDTLIEALYHVSLYQADNKLLSAEQADLEKLSILAETFSAEDAQLLYQIAIKSKPDLNLAPSLKLGFDMMVLRMLQFYPLSSDTLPPKVKQKLAKPNSSQKNIEHKDDNSTKIDHNKSSYVGEISANNWGDVIKSLKVGGITQMLANQCSVANLTNNEIELRVSEKHHSLCNNKQQQLLRESIQEFLGKPTQVSFSFGNHEQATPQEQQQQTKAHAKREATESLNKDPNIKRMMEMFDAEVSDTSVDLESEQIET